MVIVSQFAFTGFSYDENNLFQQKFNDVMWSNIRTFVINLRELPVWKDRSKAATLFGGKQNSEFWAEIFNTGNAPDGSPVLARPVNTTEMIQN